jgi:HTH-like domain
VSAEEREEIRRLKAENRELSMRVELLKKSGGHLRDRDTELIFQFMDAEKANFPITVMAEELDVSRQGHYAWAARRSAPPGPRAVSDAVLRAEITGVFAEHRGRYGVPRVHAELARRGWHVGRKRVARLMALEGLAGRCGRRKLPPGPRSPTRTPHRPRTGCSGTSRPGPRTGPG